MPPPPPPPAVFCVEDTVALAHAAWTVGVVDRCFGDVDTHQPRPQRDYGEALQRDPDIAPAAFAGFLRTGVPPRGTVLVAWQTHLATQLVPEAKLQLLDRALDVGHVVRRTADAHMSGTVVGARARCTLFPATHYFSAPDQAPPAAARLCLRDVPVDELLHVHAFAAGALVVYGDWVGRVDHVYDEVAVQLANHAVVVVEDPAELEREHDASADRVSVGDTVKTKKGNLRRGLWRVGAFDPNVKPVGVVVQVRTVEIDVQWLARSIRAVDNAFHAQEPPVTLGRDELESPAFYRYDASGSAAHTLPMAANGVDRSYHVAHVAVGDRVRFKDLTAATAKYDGTQTTADGAPWGKLTRIPRTESLGYDLNVFIVMTTHTMVTVQWQDLTVTDHLTTALLPDPNLDDDDQVWPGEVVCSKEGRTSTASLEDYDQKPAKVGVVQTVNGRNRIAAVRWFKNPSVEFFGSDLLRPSTTGELDEAIEDVSLYDIYSSPALTRQRGDFVLIHPNSIERVELPLNLTGPDWFGEVTDLGLDGKLTVRLGAATPVIDVKVPYEGVTLAYSSDVDDEYMSHDLDGHSITDDSDFETASFEEMWIEYEGMDGEAMAGDEGDWSTEDDEADKHDGGDDEHDESMLELVDSNEVDTTKTTPESKSPSPEDDKAEQSAQPQDPSITVHDTPIAKDTPTTQPTAPLPFAILDTPVPVSHHFLNSRTASTSAHTRRIAKEQRILSSSLPPSIYVRTWESRIDLLRILIIGPVDTPYEYAPFIIDMHLPSIYPTQPPDVYFHSWTAGTGPVNPNLYENGKICLSLLGTWHAEGKGEGWSGNSTLLQVLVSIMGLVLVKEPYYNEAGYDIHRSAPETKLSSALYTERAYFRARAFITYALGKPNAVEPFEQELQWLYCSREAGAPRLLDRAVEAARAIVERSEDDGDMGERDGLRKVSLGALVMLKRQLGKLEELQGGGEDGI